MQLDRLQTRFVDTLLHGSGHVILTGKAGTGKSTALCAGVKAAQSDGMDVVVMAPTAMAASIHRDNGLESGTIHHALKWNPAREPLPRKLLSVVGYKTDWSRPPDQNRLLVVDEISMVGGWLFEILARDFGDNPERPFGGRRVVAVGDWAQLPPVVGPEDIEIAKAMPELRNFGAADGCVLFHPLFTRNPPTAIMLEETHRANSEWFEKLNHLRDVGTAMPLSRFNMVFDEPDPAAPRAPVCLSFRRSVAHQRNTEALALLPGREIVLPLRDGEAGLKVGCEVIVTSNRAGSGFINGSRAIFTGVDTKGRVCLDDGRPICMLADGNWGRSVCRGDVEPDDAGRGKRIAESLHRRYGQLLDTDAKVWLSEASRDSAKVAGLATGRTVFQPYWPVLPGYAITVHKAQGSTLPNATIEEDVFWSLAPARLPYVALSRVPDETQIFMNHFAGLRAMVRPDTSYPVILSRLSKWS